MRTITKSADICVRSNQNIEFHVCKITHILNEDETFSYIFEPNYEVIAMTDSKFFQGIPGLNLELHKESYVRENMIPCFISERVPSKNREDLNALLEEVGLDYLDPIEYLLRTKLQYCGDLYYLKECNHKEKVVFEEINNKNNMTGMIKCILDNLAKGNDIVLNNKEISKESYSDLYRMLSYMYEKNLDYRKEKQIEGIALAKQNNKYKGRKPIKVDMEAFRIKYEQVLNKNMTAKQAAKELGISIDKYYRVRKNMD